MEKNSMRLSEDINLKELLAIVAKRKTMIAVLTLLATLAMFWHAVTKKDFYLAKTTVLLKASGSGLSQPNSLSTSMIFGSRTSSADDFASIIMSRRVAEIVYDLINSEEAVRQSVHLPPKEVFAASMSDKIKVSFDKLMEISVMTDNAVLSAAIANAYPEAAKEFWQKINYTSARKKLEYIEGQLPRVEGELDATENNLKKYSLLNKDPFSPTSVELARLQKEYAILSETYTMLRNEYESVKLDVAKETDPFSEVDLAQKPEKPMDKKIPFNVAVGVLMGLFSSTFLAFFLDYWQKLQ